MLKSGVYYIFCKDNNKGYVGSSYDVYDRLKWHRAALRRDKHPNSHLQNSWNKYEESSFEFKKLILCPEEYRIKLEQWFLDSLEFNTKLNQRPIAESNSGIKHSEETKDKLRILATGRLHSEETKNILSTIKRRRLKEDKNYVSILINNLPQNQVGELNSRSKLTELQVIEIIHRINNKERAKDICKDYLINNRMISEIKKKRAWKHLSHLITIE